MDWTKAKSILIAALIITNLVLIFTYVFHDSDLKKNNEEFQKDTIELLESKGIYVKTNIPKEISRMPVLTVEYDKTDQSIIDKQLAQQKPISEGQENDEKLIEITTDFIIKCDLMTENVKFNKITRNDDKITVSYKNYIEGFAVEDSYIVFKIENSKITDVKRYWLNPVEFRKTKKEIIPAVAALIKFMSENENKDKIYVEDISLVYWLDSSVFDTESPVTDTAFPAWKITYNRGQIHYVMAFEQ